MSMWRAIRTAASSLVLVVALTSGLALGAPPAHALGLVPVNDRYATKHDATLVVPRPGVLGNDLDLLGSSSSLASSPAHGALTLRSDGSFTYTPNAGYVGTDSFKYRAGLLGAQATVTLTISNAAPVARSDAYSGPARTTLSVPAPGVLINDTDADGDTLTVIVVDDGGISGSINLSSNGRLVYSPGGGFSGTATLTYRVSDGITTSNTTTVSLTIAAASPTPTPKPTPQPTVAPTPRLTVPPTPRPSSSTAPSTPAPISSGAILPIPTSPLTLPIPTFSPISPLPTLPLGPNPGPTSSSRPTPSTAPSSSPPNGTTLPGVGGSGPTGGTDGGSSTGGGAAGASTGGATNGATDGVSPPGATAVAIGPGALANADGAGSAAGSVDIELRLDGASLWFVPAAAIGGPGLLVILWILLQVGAGGIWLPAARRLRGEDRARGVTVRS
jgi:hypothetical protein